MKKVYLVPHCHWDREWYFSSDTANVLFHQNMKELLTNIKNEKQFLDGQWSLLNDYLKNSPQDTNQIKGLLQEKSISCGPFYSQPDVFNSLGETIIRNLESGNKFANSLGIENFKTAYLPDTFGFGQNLINVFNHLNLHNFVFWRGYPKKEVEKSVVFNWKNDNSKIKSLCFKDGYYSLGMYYPYNGQKGLYPEKWNPKFFAEKILQRMNENKGFKGNYIFPLGGDQAPYFANQTEFLALVQKELKDHDVELEITSNYQDFFASENFSHNYEGNLTEPFTSKIHRTIGSSRYDIKKLFRDAEHKLYYLLEPLEVYYSSLDKKYDFASYKEEAIIRPLLIAQTHDSLGTCNTDSTNFFQLSRLKSIHENIDSQVDLLIKKINQYWDLNGEELVIFNPSTQNNYVFEKKTIFSSTFETININEDNLKIKTLSSKNIAFSKTPIYQLEVLIYASNLKPLSSNVFDLNLKQYKWKNETQKTEVKSLKFDEIPFIIEAIEDKGDSYDYSPGDKLVVDQENFLIDIWKTNEFEYRKFITKIKINKVAIDYEIDVFKTSQDTRISITTFNKFKNIRIYWKIKDQIESVSQNCGLSLPKIEIAPENWKEYLSEYPANVLINDGLINLSKKSILTFGNNELFFNQKDCELTLYRTYSLVTQNNMEWRPSTSGLSWAENSPDSQLQKELTFEFVITNKENSLEALNKYHFKPYVYKNQYQNFIANKMTKFVMNDILNPWDKKLEFKINPSLFISSFRRINNDIEIRVSNMTNEVINENIILNKENKKIKLKPNEIKNVIFEGVYNE